MELQTYIVKKAFAISILTASAFIMFDIIAVRIEITNTIELTFILQQPLSSIFNLFPCYIHILISNLLMLLWFFRPLILFLLLKWQIFI